MRSLAERWGSEVSDNEIIKALECCRSTSCYDCLCNDENLCIDALLEYALDLINRQKAEIERLKADVRVCESEIKCTRIHEERARTEAIKECILKKVAKERCGEE